ncbi:dynein heavy chain, N-terminal region 1-domain-containing protein [Baffinella frigidus]|nr:dynein heavy chain, N-terminal region 1-domain-containing protein [Cryptophyta sp. CCMP2293]
MTDPRLQYVAQRLEVALDGYVYTPSVPKFLENTRVCDDVLALFQKDGPQAIIFYCRTEPVAGEKGRFDNTPDNQKRHKLTLTRPPPEETFVGKCVWFTRASNDKAVEVYQPMVSMHDNWGQCTDVHDFVSMVNKFDNFLGTAVKSLNQEVELQAPDPKFMKIENKQSAWARAAMDSDILIHFENLCEAWSNVIDKLLHEVDKKGAKEDAGPDTEYDYWRVRLQRLNDIAEHLKRADCKLIVSVLWTAKSTTMKRWSSLVNEMTDELNEAKDNVKYLTALEKPNH